MIVSKDKSKIQIQKKIQLLLTQLDKGKKLHLEHFDFFFLLCLHSLQIFSISDNFLIFLRISYDSPVISVRKYDCDARFKCFIIQNSLVFLSACLSSLCEMSLRRIICIDSPTSCFASAGLKYFCEFATVTNTMNTSPSPLTIY